MTRDAGDDAAKDERGDDHANQAQEDFAEEMGLRSASRRIHAEHGAGKHGEEGPLQQRAAAHGKGNKETDADPAKGDGNLRSRVKQRSREAGREQNGCRGGESAKHFFAGMQILRGGGGAQRWIL